MGKKIKVQVIPIENKASASRRIRFKSFFREMPSHIKWSVFNGTLDCDVMYIQKLVRDWTIQAAKKAKKWNIPVVFDLDDIRSDWKSKPYDKMLKHVSTITTDTLLKAEEISKHTDVPVVVVPDSVDYGAIDTSRVVIRDEIKSAVTFGRWQNIRSTAATMDSLNIDTAYISDRVVPEFKRTRFIKWDARNFLRTLRGFDLAVLSHHPHWAVDMKSNNRLLVCMAIGLPTVTSNTAQYVETLSSMGLGWLSSERNSISLVRSRETRKNVADTFLMHVDKYHPRHSAEILYKLFEVLNEDKDSNRV